MTEENKELEVNSGEIYGLAETPFSGYAAPKDEEPASEAVEVTGSSEETVSEPVSEEPEKTETAPVEEPVAAEQAKEAPAPSRGREEAGGQMDYSGTFRTLTEGDVVDGVVVHIDRDGVLVDVGTKSEGIIRPNELSRGAVQNPEDVVQVGDHIDVYVMTTESEDEHLMLSKKRADFERAWGRVEEAFAETKTIMAMVTDRVKGGLVVDLGIRGFVPGSHVGSGKLKNLDKYVGQSLPLRVIEVDRERRKVVLSHRLAIEEEREGQKAETLATIAEGEIRNGLVRRMTDYGAFIDLGGIDGLLHISEMSWTRINHPSDMLKVGDQIQVMVLKLNLDQGRVSLGLRQILPDPWSEVARKYHVGDVIQGKVSRLVPFGAFVQVDSGVEGIIPNAELAVRRVSKPEEVVSVGQDVEVKVLDLRVEERRMTLSLRHLQQEREREQVTSYASQTRAEQRTTVGDLVGDIMSAVARRGIIEREEEAEKEQDIQKPKPKKRPSKAERRALEEESADHDSIQDPGVAVAATAPEEMIAEAAVEEPAVEEATPETAETAETAEIAAAEPVAEEAVAEEAVAEEVVSEQTAEPVEPVAEDKETQE